MKVHFVMGLPHSGKSSYIAENFDKNKHIIVDVLEGENLKNNASEALLYTKLCLGLAIDTAYRENKDVVLEFLGLSREDRALFLKKARMHLLPNKDNQIIGHWIECNIKDILGRIWIIQEDSEKIIEDYQKSIKYPSLEECFDILYKYQNTAGIPTEEDYFITQAYLHCGYKGQDCQKAICLLKEWKGVKQNDKKKPK